MSVCGEHISRTWFRIFTSCRAVRVSDGHGLVLLWRRCDATRVYFRFWMTQCLHIVAKNRHRERSVTVYSTLLNRGSTNLTLRHIGLLKPTHQRQHGTRAESDILLSYNTVFQKNATFSWITQSSAEIFPGSVDKCIRTNLECLQDSVYPNCYKQFIFDWVMQQNNGDGVFSETRRICYWCHEKRRTFAPQSGSWSRHGLGPGLGRNALSVH